MIKKLSEAWGISGREEEVLKIITESLTNKKFNFYKDRIGNLFVTPDKNLDYVKTVFVIPVDESGIMASDITQGGYIKFQTIGQVNDSSLVSKRVKFANANGIICPKAVHLLSDDEKNKKTDDESLLIDIGATDKNDAEKYITKGDYAVFDICFKEQGEKYFGKALKSRVSVVAFIDLINKISNPNKNSAFVFSVQSQVRRRGLKVVLNQLPNAEKIILAEGVPCEENDKGVVLGVLKRDTESIEKVRSDIENAAVKNNIPYTKKLLNEEIDAPVNIIGYPVFCNGTPCNIVRKKDVEKFKKLILCLMQREVLFID